jgi:sterol desaturase/sphingolipid hydroxylase (fatty acid hydroxylase superfamily)
MRFLIAIIVLDALAYAQHRLLHRVDILWRFHAVHHSDPEVDVTTTFRHHPVEAIFNGALVGGVVLAIGFSPAEIVAYTWVVFFIELLAHANLALPSWFGAVLGKIIVTPEFHHLHHSRSNAEANANFGQAFSVWDTLFGTARVRSSEDPSRFEFGLDQFREQKFNLPHYLLAQPLLSRANAPTVTAVSSSCPYLRQSAAHSFNQVNQREQQPLHARGGTLQTKP